MVSAYNYDDTENYQYSGSCLWETIWGWFSRLF